jgi:hypothetical protein
MLGDTYEELMKSLSLLAHAGLLIAVAGASPGGFAQRLRSHRLLEFTGHSGLDSVPYPGKSVFAARSKRGWFMSALILFDNVTHRIE